MEQEKESTMFLLKTMVLLAIVSVFVTMYAEYKRMKKFDSLLQKLGTSPARRTKSSTFSASPEVRNDSDDRRPTP